MPQRQRGSDAFIVTLLSVATLFITEFFIPRESLAAREEVSSPQLRYAIDTSIPAWVKRLQTPASTPSQKAPWHYALIDDQVRVGPRSVDRHVHIVRRIVEPSGLSDASQVTLRFDPAYQKLVLHELVLLRGSQRINRLDKKNIRLLQREENLEKQFYDGITTASVVLEDLRVGDAIEYRYTVMGYNPVFENRFAHDQWIGVSRAPAVLVHARFLYPKGREILMKADGNRVDVRRASTAAENEVVLEARDVPVPDMLMDLPPNEFQRWLVRFSEYADWESVASWGDRVFTRAMTRSAAVSSQASRVASTGGTKLEMAMRALDFVQKEIRYFGVELGEYSHLPNAPERVLLQRYGDCKDKSVLLIAILQELGIQAYPVLVSNRYRRFVKEQAPSPLAFDHAIVGFEVDGRTLWVDPTRSYEPVKTDERLATIFGVGLPLRKGQSGLAEAPKSESAPVYARFRDEITIAAFDGPAALDARITYFGEWAQRVMAVWNSSIRAEMEKELAAEYSRRYIGAKQTQPFRLSENTDDGSATLESKFEIANAFDYSAEEGMQMRMYPWGYINEIRAGFSAARTQPLYLGERRRVSHTVSLKLPESVVRDPQSQAARVDDPAFTLLQRIEHDTRIVNVGMDLEILADTVTSSRWSEFHKNVVDAGNRSIAVFRFSPIPLARVPATQQMLLAVDQQLARPGAPWHTNVQARAEARRILLTEQLNSGRLATNHRAVALMARATAFNYTNRSEEALADAQLALSTDPTMKGAKAELAVILWGRGAYSESLALAIDQLKQTPNDPHSLAVAGRSHFYLGQYEEALRYFSDAAKYGAGDGKYFAVAWGMLALQRIGRPTGDLLKQFPLTGDDRRFVHQVVRYLGGEISETDLLAAAKSPNRSAQLSQICEAHFYVGMLQLSKGDRQSAKRNFELSVATKVYEFIEYSSSRFELAKLN